MTLFLNFRYQTVGGPTRAEPVFLDSDAAIRLRWVTRASVLERARERHVLIATHGYNNGMRAGACALTRLDARLALPETAVMLGVLWPGDSTLGGISYPVEKRTAEETGRNLAAFINARLGDTASLSFASHSLGARVVLETVRRLSRPVKSATLMAGAIERDCLTEEYADAFAKIGIVTVLASRGDTVLRGLFPLGNLLANLLDPTANPLSKALGFEGPQAAIGRTVPPWQLTGSHAYRHGDYLPPSDPAVPLPAPDAPGAYFEQPLARLRSTFLAEL